MKEKIKTMFKSPEEMWELLKEYFNQDRRFIFLLTMIAGLITHFILISNLILSQDGLLNGIHYTAGGYEATLGRWGIDLFDSIRNNIAFPFITTLISIVILGFVNIFIVDLFEIKGKLFRILTTIVLVVSPSLCMTLLYAYTADVYFYSMFFAVFTVYSLYKIKNKKIGFLLGMISFVLMLSTYQSYMGITVALILMLAVKRLLTEEGSSLKVLKEILIKAVILGIYVVTYYLVTKIILRINHLTMSSYGGLNGIGLATILGSLGESIKNAYVAFVKYFFADGVILNRQWRREKMYLIFFALYGLAMLILFVKGLKNENKKDFFMRFFFACILIVLFPIALNLVVIAAPGNEIYYLTATQMALILPFVLMTFEMLQEKLILSKMLNWGIVFMTAVILETYFLSVVITYETTELSYNQARGIVNRVISRMEEYPGYRSDMKKLFAGIIDDTNFNKTMDIYNYTVANSLRTSLFHATYWGHESTWSNFYNLFFGMQINFCDDYEYYTIIHSDEFKEMDIFPGKNSVKMINDVMVVKFTNSPSEPPPSQNLMEHGIFIP